MDPIAFNAAPVIFHGARKNRETIYNKCGKIGFRHNNVFKTNPKR